MAIYWAFIYFEGELNAPVLLVFLFLTLMYGLTVWREKPTYPRTIGVGVILGVTALVSPNMLLMPLVIFVWFWWINRGKKGQAGFILKNLVLLTG